VIYLNITIEIIYRGYEHKILQSGSFQVNVKAFKENEKEEAARVALNWIDELKKETPHMRMIKVKYNGNDITDLITARM
jgi:hypothetical protein